LCGRRSGLFAKNNPTSLKSIQLKKLSLLTKCC